MASRIKIKISSGTSKRTGFMGTFLWKSDMMAEHRTGMVEWKQFRTPKERVLEFRYLSALHSSYSGGEHEAKKIYDGSV